VRRVSHMLSDAISLSIM